MSASVPPQPPVIADAEVCQGANDEPVRVSLAGDGQLNDPLRDKLRCMASRARGKLKPTVHSDLFSLEDEGHPRPWLELFLRSCFYLYCFRLDRHYSSREKHGKLFKLSKELFSDK
jgi:hypothetical protein